MQNLEIWQNQEIWVAFKFVLKFEIFDQPGHAKCKIWQHRKICVALKLCSDLKFLITPVLQNVKFVLKFKIFDHHGPAKREIWQNEQIWVMLIILLPSRSYKMWNL